MTAKRRGLRPVLVMEPLWLPGLDALPPPYDVLPPIPWLEVEALLRDAAPATVVVLDPYEGEGFPRLRELMRRFPSLTVVVALVLRPESLGDVATLLEWGVSEVIDREVETLPRALAARLRQAHARPFKRRLEGALMGPVSAEERTILLAAAEVAVEGGGAPELARRVRMSPRTLTGRCARAGLPPPRQVQAWMRVLLACALLEDPGRTVQSAAYACGYATDRSLRRAVSALLGSGAAALRREGAFARAARAFNEALRTGREDARERRRAGHAGEP